MTTTFADILQTITAPVPEGARVITNEKDEPMPRGVYERKKKDGATPPVAKNRGGRPKKNAPAPVAALAPAFLVDCGQYLVEVLRESVDLDEAPELARALRGYEMALSLFLQTQ